MVKGRLVPAVVFSFSLLACPRLALALEVGEKAPDFSLRSTQEGSFKLSDAAGKKNVIVQFYVLDFTPT